MWGDDLSDFVVRHEGPVDARDAFRRPPVEHVALAEQLLGALLAEDGAAVDLARSPWKEMRVGKLALIVPVMTSTDGRCVAMMRWMPAARAIWASLWDRALDVLACEPS